MMELYMVQMPSSTALGEDRQSYNCQQGYLHNLALLMCQINVICIWISKFIINSNKRIVQCHIVNISLLTHTKPSKKLSKWYINPTLKTKPAQKLQYPLQHMYSCDWAFNCLIWQIFPILVRYLASQGLRRGSISTPKSIIQTMDRSSLQCTKPFSNKALNSWIDKKMTLYGEVSIL